MSYFDVQKFNYRQSNQLQTENTSQKMENKINRDSKDAIEFNMAMSVDSMKSDEILRMLTQSMKTGSSMNM